jgi:hypothetical protein
MMALVAVEEDRPELAHLLFHYVMSSTMSRCRMRPLPDAGTMLLDFLASRTVKNNFIPL